MFGTTTGPKSFNTKKSVTPAPGPSMNVRSEFDTGAGCTPFGYPGATSGNTNNMKLLTDREERTITADVNALGASAKFTWKVKKTANY